MVDNQQRDPSTQWDIVSSVGYTALAVAGGRAVESERSDRLVNDPYAEPLVQAAGTDLASHKMWLDSEQIPQGATSYMGVRSRFFDEFFASAGEAGIRQVVILASGLDTRAQRLEWPAGTRVFEVDQPLVLDFKDTVLKGLGVDPACELHQVAVDLRDDWPTALTEAGFDSSLPTAWLAEGLVPYLPADAETQLLHTMHEFSAPGSRISIECYTDRYELANGPAADYARQMGMDMAQLFNFEDRPAPDDQLLEHGWKLERERSDEAANAYGRPLTEFEQETMLNQQYFLTAELP